MIQFFIQPFSSNHESRQKPEKSNFTSWGCQKLLFWNLAAAIALILASNFAIAQEFEIEVPVLESSERYVFVQESRPEEVCREVTVKEPAGHNSHTPEIVGAIVGGALGKEIHDSKSAKVAGALLGASIARDIEKRSRRRNATTRTELVCNTVNKNVQVRKIDGYSVKYKFGNETLSSVVDSNPGSTIRIRVSATPIE